MDASVDTGQILELQEDVQVEARLKTPVREAREEEGSTEATVPRRNSHSEAINLRVRALQYERSLPRTDPVIVMRDCLVQVYQALAQVIDQGSRPAAKIGFLTHQPEPVSVDRLVAACGTACKVMGPIVTQPVFDQKEAFLQGLCKDLNALLLDFRLGFMQREFEGGVPEPALAQVVQQCIAFQRQIADPMTHLNSLSHGILIQQSEAA